MSWAPILEEWDLWSTDETKFTGHRSWVGAIAILWEAIALGLEAIAILCGKPSLLGQGWTPSGAEAFRYL